MLQIFDVTANENVCYKRNELEYPLLNVLRGDNKVLANISHVMIRVQECTDAKIKSVCLGK